MVFLYSCYNPNEKEYFFCRISLLSQPLTVKLSSIIMHVVKREKLSSTIMSWGGGTPLYEL